MTREHLLRAAGRQFVEGDVQHWWLPPTVKAFARDFRRQGLAGFCVAHYVEATEDRAVLQETVQFIEGHALSAGEHDSYYLPMVADEKASLFEHCAERSIKVFPWAFMGCRYSAQGTGTTG